jgi:hypothetical protein
LLCLVGKILRARDREPCLVLDLLALFIDCLLQPLGQFEIPSLRGLWWWRRDARRSWLLCRSWLGLWLLCLAKTCEQGGEG